MTTRLMPALAESHASTADAPANGRLGMLESSRGSLVLQALGLDVQIDDLLAAVNVRQTFHNPHDTAVEATYIFPLPDRAAVTRFHLTVNGRVIEGVLQERSTARAQYEEAIRQGHTAAVTEEERPNVFTLRVGNLLPGESAAVELTLVQPLGYDEGEATFQFPLVVAPRYIPGTELPGDSVGLGTLPDTDAVPDASRITPPVLLPGYPYPVQLAARLKLRQGLSDLGQASLPIRHTGAEGAYVIWDLEPGSRLDRDLILRFRLAREVIACDLIVTPDEPGSAEGTFALTLLPPTPSPATTTLREIVFVLDRSGSMEGWKLVAARRALGRMIDSLNSADRFKILAFDDRVDPLPPQKAWYAGHDRQRFEALEALAKIQSRGGTELAAPLEQAVRLLGESRTKDSDKILVLITDGQVGNEDQILKHLHQKLAGLRVFTLGVDQAVNEGFLRRLAALGGGTTEVVESEGRLDAVMDRIHRRIAAPVLRDLRVEAEGMVIDTTSQVPAKLPDLFPGAPLVITGRCTLPARGGLHVRAIDDAGRPWSQTLEPQPTTAPAVRWTWARGLVRGLEDQYVCQRNAALEKRIVDHSLKFGVLCRFTAFVAIDRSRVANPGGKLEQIVQPVELPAGWDSDRMTIRGATPMYCRMASPAPRENFIADTPCSFPISSKHRTSYLEELDAEEDDKPASIARLTQALGLSAGEVDLAPYRRRAAELVELLQKDANNPLRTLGLVQVRLHELVEDVISVGVSSKEVLPLVELVNKLRQVLAANDAVAAAALAPEVEAALRQFAEGDNPASTPGKRKAKFWK